MINRRTVTSGLLASLATGLTSCGGTLPSEADRPGNLAGKNKGNWKQSFGSPYTDTGPDVRRKRTSPPTIAELMQPGPLKEMTLGRVGAKVTVIEYISPTCPVCRAFHEKTWPTFKRTYIDTGKILYIAREFPIGRASGNAALAIRCQESRYFDLVNAYLSQQKRWVSQEVRLDAIHAIAAPFGLTRAKFDTCLANKDLIKGITQVKQRGRDLGVIGTPTFFINGKQLRGALTMETLRAEIDPLLV